MKGITVRARQREDRADVLDVLNAAIKRIHGSIGGDAGTPVDSLHIQNTTGLVVTIKNRIVGTVSYRMRGGRLHLFDLAVVPSHRRNGIARLLVDELASIAAAARVRMLTLQTIDEAGTVPIFERLGFRVQSTKCEFLFSSRRERALTTVYMVKRLDSRPSSNNGRWW